ncbi:cytochrome-c peroxidase [Nostoc sp. PA-18-2419]|uniref:cytochrome-c peroxidase n=1 Tax=Nostoc sp. PA-18-2419 TaxID=2575443 RepID=UPI001CB992C8|nr:cytochrome c peroxidase [Nostoc sp. PA-18-2419]
MGLIAVIVLVLVLASLPIYLLLTSNGRCLLKFLVTNIEQAVQSLASDLKLLHFNHQKFSRATPPFKLAVDIKLQRQRYRAGKLKPLKSSSKTIVIAAMITVAVIAGNSVSAQITASPASLKNVSVPQPDNLGDFVKDKVAAIKLGKALFWDMQVGSDGVTSCASCHFHAGADNRSKNQIAPGLLRVNADGTQNPDTVFDIGGLPNYQLKPEDFPFHKLSDPNNPASVISDRNDVSSSQGVTNNKFVDVIPGSAQDQVKTEPDPVFNVGGINVRRVQARNTPSVINAAFNFRNFWDGRAQNTFNGVNPFGLRDPNASVVKAETPNQLKFVKVSLNNSSLASQAVGPPLSSFEVSADGRTFQEIGDKFGRINRTSLSAGRGKKLPRKLGKKLFPLRPLGQQVVHPQDSVLGRDSRWPKPGLRDRTYDQMIKDAFKPEWWRSYRLIQVDSEGRRTFVTKPDRSLETNEYTLMEYNFSLFFGLAIQLYESTLIANDTPYDRFLEGNTTALTQQQQLGKQLFEGKALCIGCHIGSELTAASVTNVKKEGRIKRAPFPPNGPEDTGFFKIGVRPTTDDLGLGGNDGLFGNGQGNPLSEARVAQLAKFQVLLGENPPTLSPPLNPSETVFADGAFKAPGLRNVELTAPYFHNGGQATLEQVIDFYNRGGDFGVLPPLNLSPEEKQQLVVFLKGLTDDRVRYEKAPFDHPQLFVPNGHPGNSTHVTDDGTGKATDSLLEIPAVGRNGGSAIRNFLN